MNTASSSPPVTILIAEDSPTQAERLRMLLERRGYEVIVAADGRAALELARKHHPTLVISDVVMPEMDGYMLSHGIKADPALRHTPVMLVTSLSDPHDVIRGIEVGADNFVVKPFEETYLTNQVRFLLVNRAMNEAADQAPALTIHFKGESHRITATREQILNLLLSTYEAAVERNRELARSQSDLQAVNRQLESAMREIESFSHSVSHDLRAPLHKIHGFGQVLLEDHAASLDATGRHYLERMIAGAAKMEELIEAMLALSRVSQADLVAGPVDVTAIATRILDDLKEHDAARRCECEVEPGLAVWGDARLFEAALTNLLSTAWKFTGGREPSRIAVGSVGGDALMDTLFVRDNGAGFDAAGAKRLFSPFHRMHSDHEFPGTGIGLATVRRVIERHGGSVWAESAPGQGATFYIAVPRAASEDEAPAAADA
jgi:two-component system, sensor histidine kinase and response regulator